MIHVSRLNNEKFYINSNLIETMEEKPDTVLTLVNDKKYIVKEKASQVIEMIIQYNQKIFLEKNRIN